jgi:hypothetical protein
MASRHREQHIVDAVDCPLCGKPRGQQCFRGAHGPGVHQERREAWEAAKTLCPHCDTRHHAGHGPAGYPCFGQGRYRGAKAE